MPPTWERSGAFLIYVTLRDMKRAGVGAIVVGFAVIFTVVLFNIGSKPAGRVTFQDVTSRVNGDWKMKSNYVVRSSDDLRKAGITTDIDVNKNMLLVTALGGSTGHDVKVTNIYRENGMLTVDVEDASPGDGCVTAQVITYPHFVAQIPASNDSVTFNVTERKVSC
jgi:hypothetical protein